MGSARPARRRFQQRVVEFARQNAWFGKVFNAITWQRSRTVASFFESYLPASGRLLDIGAGTGHVATLLQHPAREVVACDIMDLLMLPLPYVICDGKQLPFATASFDATLLVTVLHHVSKPEHAQFLSEAARVLKPGGKLVLMEDTYRSAFELQATKFFDSVMNGEFAGHPHANRTLTDWMELMKRAGFRLEDSREHVAWYGMFRIRHGMVIGVRE
jgi:ubiquinone/menaquinone biosynthesis C-methylase UbiE